MEKMAGFNVLRTAIYQYRTSRYLGRYMIELIVIEDGAEIEGDSYCTGWLPSGKGPPVPECWNPGYYVHDETKGFVSVFCRHHCPVCAIIVINAVLCSIGATRH